MTWRERLRMSAGDFPLLTFDDIANWCADRANAHIDATGIVDALEKAERNLRESQFALQRLKNGVRWDENPEWFLEVLDNVGTALAALKQAKGEG